MRRTIVFAIAGLLFDCSSAGSSQHDGVGGEPPPGGGPSDAGAAETAAGEGGGDASSTCSGSVPLTYQAATDRNPHQVSPPTLGPAGTIVKDPTYGTSILRLTDASTTTSSTSYRVANEFWGNDWSTDAKLFYFQASTGGLLAYTLDPSKLSAAPVQDMTHPGTPLKMTLGASGGFSRTESTVLYGMTGLTIERFDFATQAKTTVVDLTTIVPGATGAALGVEQGTNGSLVSAFGGPQQDKMPYVATYDPATQAHHVLDVTQSTLDGKPVGTTIGGGVHTFKIDSSGRYVVIGINGGSGSDWLWDTQSETVTAMASYGAVGWAAWEHDGNSDSYDWGVSAFASPAASVPLVSPLLTPADKLASASVSWANSVGGPSMPLVVETMRQPADTGPWRAWDEEIMAVRTDGTSSEVWRFAHTFNTYSGTTYSDAYYYLFIPRVSQNGWFVLFDSNWNGTLGTDASGNPRTDAFIVALPNPCGP